MQEQLYQRDIEESTLNAWFFVSRKTGLGDEDFTPGRRISFASLLKVPELNIEAVANWRSALAIDGPGVYVFGNGVDEIDNSGVIQLGGSFEHNTEFEVGDYTVDFVCNSSKRLSIKDNLIEIINAPVGNIKLGNAGCQIDIFSEDNGQSGGAIFTGYNGYFNHNIGSTVSFEIPETNTKMYLEEGLIELQSSNDVNVSFGTSINLSTFNQRINLYEDVTEILNGENGEVYIGRSAANIRVVSNTDGTNIVNATANSFDFILPNNTKYHIEDELHELSTPNGSIYLDGYSAALISNDGYNFNVNADGFQFIGMPNSAGDTGYIYRDSNGFLKIS